MVSGALRLALFRREEVFQSDGVSQVLGHGPKRRIYLRDGVIHRREHCVMLYILIPYWTDATGRIKFSYLSSSFWLRDVTKRKI